MNQPPANPSPQVGKWLITASVMIPTMIEILDTSVANVSLTHIQGSLSAGQEEVTWVLTSYLVANAVVIPMSGWLARLLGRKRYLLASLVVFTLSSLLCGTATSLDQLIFFRILQGVGGGGLQPMCTAILLETFPPHERGLAMAIYGMGATTGPILGPLLGGYLTDNLSWRWIFYVNLPIGLLALFMNQSFIHDPPYLQRWKKGEEVDYMGLALLCLGVGCLQIVLDKGQQEDWFSSDFILILTLISALCLIGLVFWELGHKQPVLDLRIFGNRGFAAGNMVMFLGFFAFFGSIVLLPIFLQTLMGYTAFHAGLVLGPAGAISLLMLPLIGKLTQKLDARLILGAGLVTSAYSLYYMSGFNLSIDFFTAVLARVIQGAGMPMFFVSLSFLTMAYVTREQMNNASAIFNLIRNLGGSFGVAFVTTFLARRAQFHQARLVEHIHVYNPGYTLSLDELKTALSLKLGAFTDQTHAAAYLIYGRLRREAAVLAFNDAFYIQAWLFLGLILFLWMMRRPPAMKDAPPGAH
ncbi:MAG: DHA2 family efflux MFS transporter permease subunit [Thermodesulfobacteriota bacterium]